MQALAGVHNVGSMATMTVTKRLNWPWILGFALIALVRPLFSILGLSDAFGKPATPILLTVAITAVWVLIAGFGKVRDPLITLVGAGVAYAVIVAVGSAILSPILTGQLQGPLAMPFSIIPLLLLNAVWGAVAGALAMVLQRLVAK